MPANKDALLRYQAIDRCLQNTNRSWTLQDLIDECNKVLEEEHPGIDGISERTIRDDLKVMRSGNMGYTAPIVVYNVKYYRYNIDGYSINNGTDLKLLKETADLLDRFQGFEQFPEVTRLTCRIKETLNVARQHKPVVYVESVPNLRGLHWLKHLYENIVKKQATRIRYKKFDASESKYFTVSPYLLKEYRNRWFLYCSFENDPKVYNFALDRIEYCAPVDEKYYENVDFNPDEYFKDLIGVTRKDTDAQPITIQFWADPRWSNYIRTKPLHASQKRITTNDDGSQVFQIQVIENPELYSTLMYYGPGIKVLSPDNVKTTIQQKLRDAAQLYDS